MASLTASVRVLLVEDNSADLALVQASLKDFGHPQIDITTVTRLADALEALKNRSFHVIISDLNLPDNEGLQTFYKLKEASPDSAFVVMSGLDDRDICMQAVRAGAQDYLVKGDSGPRRIWQSVRNAIVRQGILLQVSSSAKELGEVNTRLQDLARVDPLTGLYNRRGFDEHLAHEAFRPHAAVNSVLLLDIDDFKRVNDRLGHDQGDLALLEVSRRLRESLRPGDIAARVGGDEFMVFLPETPLDSAMVIAERIRRSVDENPVPSAAGGFRITVSVGIARQTDDVGTAHELLARTHEALAMSKEHGKNRVSHGEAGFDAPLPDGAAEVRVLKRPIFRLADGHITAYEFLCRSWPATGTPDRTDPTGAPRALPAFQQCLHAASRLPAGLECHIRLHCTDLVGLVPADLLRALPQGLDPALVSLEIRDLGHAPASIPVLPFLRKLRDGGIRPILHDTDLLQHTTSILMQLEPDWVKVGRGWFCGVAADPFKEGSLRGLLKIVDGLGARAIACGVENWEDLDVLRQLNVSYGQGPLWSRHT
jgi:diguanylate cyclase (GGDEF)-like protein